MVTEVSTIEAQNTTAAPRPAAPPRLATALLPTAAPRPAATPQLAADYLCSSCMPLVFCKFIARFCKHHNTDGFDEALIVYKPYKQTWGGFGGLENGLN